MTMDQDVVPDNPFFRTLVEDGGCGIVALDGQGRIRLWNAWIAERTGLPPDRALGRHLSGLLPGMPAVTVDTCAQVLATGRPRVLSPLLHGEILPLRGRSCQMGRFCPVSDEAGQVAGMVLFLYDQAPTLDYERMAREEAAAQREQAERILRESEEKYRSLVNQSSEALFVHDLDGRFMDVNEAALTQTGYTRAELLGMNVFDFHPDPTDSAGIRKQWRAWPKGGSPVRLQTLHRRKDGTVIPVEVSTSKISYGGWDFMLALVMDISERKETEERQKRLARRLEGLWQLSRLADADEETFSGHILAECLDITGSRFGFLDEKESTMVSYSLSRDVREDCQTSVHPVVFSIPEAGVWAEAVRRREPLVMNDYTAPHPAKKGLPEGHVPLTRLLAVPFLTEGKASLLVAVANKETDYTEEDLRQLSSFMESARLILDRRRSDQALRESEEKFRILADATPVAIMLYQDDKWIYANRAAESICGYTSKELLSMDFWAFVHPDHRTVIREEGRKRQRGEETAQRHKFKIVAKDGLEKWVDLSGASTIVRGRPAGIVSVMDVTDSRRTRAALRQSEENFRRSLDESPLGVRIVSGEGETLYANRTFLDIFGCDSLETFDAIPSWERYTPESYAGFLERREKRRSGQAAPMAYEIDIVRKDGEIRHLQVFRKEVLWNGERRYQALYNDITAQREAEERSRRDQYLLQLAGKLACLGGWRVDLAENRVHWSDEVADIHDEPHGFSPSVGQGIAYYAPPWREKIQEVFTACARDGVPYDEEMEIVTARGRRVWVRTVGQAERDASGAIVAVSGAFQDISERKRLDEDLRLSGERYRAFVRQSSEAICCFEMEGGRIDRTSPVDEQIDRIYARGVIRECNREFVVSHGFQNPGDMIGFRFGQVLPRLARENVANLRRFIAAGYQLAGMESKELFLDGSVRYFLNSLSGHMEDDSLVRIWATKQDITRIKAAEEEIRVLNAELEQRVKQRTAQLEAANSELEAFAYSVSHDLRAPLRAIDGYTRILLEDYAPLLDDEARRVCSVISGGAGTMGRLIDDLLSFSRVGRAEMQSSTVDMAALAQRAFNEITSPGDRQRIDFRVAPLPPAKGDRSLLRQVWANLVGNAVKFSSGRQRAVIEVSAETGDAGTIYSIRDNGAGFDMRYADKLFSVFQRLHGAHEFEGTGVGLAIVQRIVKRHGGRVWGEGETDRGAAFHFTLGDAV